MKPADKGSAVVVLSTEDYIKEADRQLNNQSYYKKLDADPPLDTRRQLGVLLTPCSREGKSIKDQKLPDPSPPEDS